MRLDKYLQVTGLIKRRTLSNEACKLGLVSVNNVKAKPTKEIAVGDIIDIKLAKREILEFQSHCLGERDGAIDIRFRDSLPLTPIGKVDTMQLEREESTILSEINFDELTANVKKKILK